MDVSTLKAHLGDELFSQVEEALKSVDGLTIIPTNDGSWVPKSRLSDEIGKRKALNDTITDLTSQLKEANDKLAASGSLQSQVDKLTQDLADRDQTITGMKRAGKVRETVIKSRPRDPDVVIRLLDQSKIGEDDKGNITGVDDQLKAMRQASPFLFNDGGGQHGGWGGGKDTGGNGGGASGNSEFNAIIRAAAGRSVE